MIEERDEVTWGGGVVVGSKWWCIGDGCDSGEHFTPCISYSESVGIINFLC